LFPVKEQVASLSILKEDLKRSSFFLNRSVINFLITMASKYTKPSVVTATKPTVTKEPVVETKVEPTPTPTSAAPSPEVQGNAELAQKVEALEAKVNDLIARLSRKMSL